MGHLDYIDKINFNTRNFPKCSHIVEQFPPSDASDVVIKICRCWQSKKFPYCDDIHKALAEAGDNVGPFVAVLKSRQSKKNSALNIKQPLGVNSNKFTPYISLSSKVALLALTLTSLGIFIQNRYQSISATDCDN